MLSIFGGKITTFRKLAEHTMEHIAELFPEAAKPWTAGAVLPGGDIAKGDFEGFLGELESTYPQMPSALLRRLARAYGTRARAILADARTPADLGQDFGGGLHAREIDYLTTAEWARDAEDILFRRSKLGLHVPPAPPKRSIPGSRAIDRCGPAALRVRSIQGETARNDREHGGEQRRHRGPAPRTYPGDRARCGQRERGRSCGATERDPQTIRKDLNVLAGQSLLSRVHGGALITSGVDNLAYDKRRDVASDAKARIGAAAAALIPDGASLFVNIGTTTEAVAANFTHHRNLMVISNNLNVIDTLSSHPALELVSVGGKVRTGDRAVVGALAMRFIENFRVDYALIGISALDADGSLLDFAIDEVEVSQTIIRNARKVILVADSSKVGRSAPVRVCGMEAIDFSSATVFPIPTCAAPASVTA